MKNEKKPTTKQAIDNYFRQLAKGRVFSVAGAVEEVRDRMPGCELTDTELAELLARHAVALGFSPISFDRRAIRHRIELAVRCEISGYRPAAATALQPVPNASGISVDAKDEMTASLHRGSPS